MVNEIRHCVFFFNTSYNCTVNVLRYKELKCSHIQRDFYKDLEIIIKKISVL